MGRKIYSPEQIIRKLREAEVLINQGNNLVSKELYTDLKLT